MGYLSARAPGLLQRMSVVVVVCLLLAFCLHSIQTPHAHYSEHHSHTQEKTSPQTFLGEYMHLADKKFLITIVIFFVLLCSFLNPTVWAWHGMLVFARTLLVSLYEKSCEQYRLFCYLSSIFRKGIIHSKAF